MLIAPTKLPAVVDIAVVGGGFAGLNTAYWILRKHPFASLALLESRFIGFGASGRSAGLLSPLAAPVWLIGAGDNPDHAWATSYLNRSIRSRALQLQTLAPDFEVTEVTFSLRSSGHLSDGAIRYVSGVLSKLPIEHAVVQSDRHLSLSMAALALNPVGAMRALVDFVQSHEHAAVYENAHVSTFQKSANGDSVSLNLHDGRSVEARRTVVCTNAYSDLALLPRNTKRQVVVSYLGAASGLDSVTESAPPVFVADLNLMGTYYRYHSGHLLYGGVEHKCAAGSRDVPTPSRIRRRLSKHMNSRFSNSHRMDFSAFWSGKHYPGYLRLPYVEASPTIPSLLYNCQYGGTGLGLSMVFSERAADLALVGTSPDPETKRLHEISQATRVSLGALSRTSLAILCGSARRMF
jgi:glycine/D-amino acid oxidase-like deaminating enzyme